MQAVLIRLIAAAHFGLFAYVLVRTAISSPISDMFGYVDHYLRYRAGQVSLPDYLWRAHGEHHLVWIRLFTWIDVERFGTRGIAFMAAATAAIAATAAVTWRELARAMPKHAPTRSLDLLAAMLILSTANVTDCSVPINTTYPLTVFFVVLAIVLFAADPHVAAHPQARAAAAVPAAFMASFGTAAGLLAWPILGWLAWRERRKGWLALWAGAGLCYILFYSHDINPIGLAPALEKDAGAFTSAAHLRKLADYFFAFLGLPVTREPQFELLGRALGMALFLCAAAAVLVATLTTRLNTTLDRIAIGMILLGLGAAALATIGRSDMIEEVQVPVRYTMFTTALHVGLLCIVLPRWAARAADVVLWAGLMFAAALLVQQIFVGRSAARIAQNIALEADCFAQGTPRLLYEARGPAVGVKAHHAVPLRLAHPVRKNGRALFAGSGARKHRPQPAAIEEIVTENQADLIAIKELARNQNGAGNAVRFFLLGIGELDAPLRSASQQGFELREIFGSGNNENVTNAGKHQHRQRIIHHRLVIDGQELL